MFAEVSDAQIAIWIAVFTALFTCANKAWDSWLNFKRDIEMKKNTQVTVEAKQEATEAKEIASQTKTAINGRMDELLVAERAKAHAEGLAQGRAEAQKALIDAKVAESVVAVKIAEAAESKMS